MGPGLRSWQLSSQGGISSKGICEAWKILSVTRPSVPRPVFCRVEVESTIRSHFWLAAPQDLFRRPTSRNGHGGLHTITVQAIDRLLELLFDIPSAADRRCHAQVDNREQQNRNMEAIGQPGGIGKDSAGLGRTIEWH